jgi:hypothetical protein
MRHTSDQATLEMDMPTRDGSILGAGQHSLFSSAESSAVENGDASSTILQLLPAACREKLAGVLAAHPKAAPIIGQGHLTIPAISPDGFTISLINDSGRWTLAMGGWHDDFNSISRAIDYIGEALNGKLRIRIDSDYKQHTWAVERLLSDGTWVEQDRLRAARLFFKYRTQKSVYLRNG